MKRIITTIVTSIAIMTLAAGCTMKPQTATKTSIGNPYEAFVLCDNDAWSSGIDSAIYRSVGARVLGLPRPESYFYVLGSKSQAEASDMDRKYANLLSININPIYTEPALQVEDNVYARPQVVVSLNAPTAESAKRFIEEQGAEIAGHFEIGERNRSLTNSRRSSTPKLMEQFKKHTGIDMHIPAGFGRANSGDRSLLWFMRDYEKKAQYIFAFSQKYNDPSELQGAALERMIINKLAVVHTDKPGSRMTISQTAPIYFGEVVANDRLWYELRGCWEVTLDQMGGPFVSFSTLDQERGIITTILFALYAPEEQQRGLMGELEYLIYTTK
ncbi:MAG: DUF4837 family protein [Alistipes sp.]|nr:DUF4837 family protein [Alistipes sp.]